MPNVIINEVCWMGGEGDPYAEWLELKNESGRTVDLKGWRLKAEDGIPDIGLMGRLEPGGLLLLRRSTDYKGALENDGENLFLLKEGVVVDRVEQEGGWEAGRRESGRTMERRKDGGWQTSLEEGGTPGEENGPGLTGEVDKKETVVLPPRAYRVPARARLLWVVGWGLSVSFLLAAGAVLVKRRLDR